MRYAIADVPAFVEPGGAIDTEARLRGQTLYAPDGRIPQGESMQELSDRMHAALTSCLELPAGSRPLLVSHGMALGCLVSTILGLPAYAERRLRLRNCSISRVDYQQSPWLASGWVVETAGDVSYLDAPAMDELQR